MKKHTKIYLEYFQHTKCPETTQGKSSPSYISIKVGLKKVADDKALGRKLLKGSGKFLRGAGKIIKPLGVLTGIAAVNTAVKAGERNPFDLTGAYITGDAQIATDARRMRQEPEFRKQQIAGLPQIQPEGFNMMEEEDFTSYFNGGIVAVKGVIN